MNSLKFFISIFLLVIPSECYKILIATPSAVKSEASLVSRVAWILANAGHEIVYITSFEPPEKHPNVKVVYLHEMAKALEQFSGSSDDMGIDLDDSIIQYYKIQYQTIWDDANVNKIWNIRKTFDAFLTMALFGEGNFPFLLDNGIPFIQLSSTEADGLTLARDGNRIPSSIMPTLFGNYDVRMTFWERLINTWSTMMYHYKQRKLVQGYTENVAKKFPEISDFLSFYDRLSLTLINGHHVLDESVPLLPNQVEVGLVHIKEPKPIEKEILDFIEGSGDAGVVYFSLGSIWRSSAVFSKETKNELLKAFGQLKQRIIWKYEEEDGLEMPRNVMVRKWLPQQDILAHPKTKVFISHCGNFGIQEAKYFGIPILGIPIYFDQHRNGAKLQKKNIAIILDFKNVTAASVLDGIHSLLHDTGYKERMNNISKLLKDQKESPAERLVWWTEYIIRNRGSDHLKYAGKRLSFFQYMLLDVALFLLGCCCCIVFFCGMVWRFFKAIWAKCFGQKQKRNYIKSKKQ